MKVGATRLEKILHMFMEEEKHMAPLFKNIEMFSFKKV